MNCEDEIKRMLREGKSEEVLLEDVIERINNFYSQNKNLIIPVIFAYCYCIKKLAGASKEGLNNYKKEVLIFFRE